jgi:hypothetical protein
MFIPTLLSFGAPWLTAINISLLTERRQEHFSIASVPNFHAPNAPAGGNQDQRGDDQ